MGDTKLKKLFGELDQLRAAKEYQHWLSNDLIAIKVCDMTCAKSIVFVVFMVGFFLMKTRINVPAGCVIVLLSIFAYVFGPCVGCCIESAHVEKVSKKFGTGEKQRLLTFYEK